MDILISFCNQRDNPSNKNLLVYNTVSGHRKWLSFGEINYGVVGISQTKSFIFALYQGSINGIVVIDKKDFKIILDKKIKELKDPHSLLSKENGDLYIASTGNDRVLKYFFKETEKTVEFIKTLWMPKNSNGKYDTHHINSIFSFKDELLISAFGLKKGEKWISARNGYIYNITKERIEIENIYQPHSLFVKGGDIYYCESRRSGVMKNRSKIIELGRESYTRGLAIKGGYLFLGASKERKVSKSTGLPNDIDIVTGGCELFIFRRDENSGEYKLSKKINFSSEKSEIYDIMPLEIPENQGMLVNFREALNGLFKSKRIKKLS